MTHKIGTWAFTVALGAILPACGGGDDNAGSSPAVAQAEPVACNAIKQRSFANTTIASSEPVAAGSLTIGGTTLTDLPAFCRVVATISPSADEQIGVEIWLPAQDWNGRFLGVGNGGLAGSIVYSSTTGGIGALGIADAIRKGYATASTDTGHSGNATETPNVAYPWMRSQAKIRDWGQTSIHEMTVLAKSVATVHYGRAPDRSYFDGCSTGGGQGMEEAIYYPEDYDGIHAATPGSGYARLMSQFMSGAKVFHDNPGLGAKLGLVNAASVAACDAQDGVTDSVIENPLLCSFSPVTLQCAAGTSGPGCLTPDEVSGVQKIYAVPTNPRTGEQIYPGMAPGSESGWSLIPALAQVVSVPLLQNMVFADVSWNYLTFDYDHDVAFVDDKVGPIITATSPDLSKFQARGGKLLMNQGWGDPFAAQTYPIEYRRKVVQSMGLSQTDSFYRLFMVPGAGHCAGGTGPNRIDAIGTLQAWVEQGVAPDRIVATKFTDDDPAKAVVRTRPLCAWPKVATYKGSGSTDDEASFSCS